MSFLFMFHVHCWDEPTLNLLSRQKEAGPFVATQTGPADNFGSVLVAKFGPARTTVGKGEPFLVVKSGLGGNDFWAGPILA